MNPTIVSNSWKVVSLQIPTNIPNIKLSIRFSHYNPFVGGFAIDDMKLTPGLCTSIYGSYCDFEAGYCGYQVIRRAPPGNSGIGIIYNWQMSPGSRLPGPQKDHSSQGSLGKYFLFANRAVDPIGLYQTQLIINSLPTTGIRGSCLKFWYQISSNFSSSFYVYAVPQNSLVYNTPHWVATYPNYTTWTMGEVTINAPYLHKIVFSFAQNKNNLAYIALDDVSLTSGACEPPISCDFDTDMCSWHDLKTIDSNWNWGRFTGIFLKLILNAEIISY
jgi:hypothetical protein